MTVANRTRYQHRRQQDQEEQNDFYDKNHTKGLQKEVTETREVFKENH